MVMYSFSNYEQQAHPQRHSAQVPVAVLCVYFSVRDIFIPQILIADSGNSYSSSK